MPHQSPLSPDEQEQLAHAGLRVAKIMSAARVAAFNGWTLGAFAVISLLFSFSSLTALLMGLGLGWVAWNEFKGKNRIRTLDVTAPDFLGKNQLGLMALIVVYSLVSIYRALTQPLPHLSELEEAIGPVGDLITSLAVSVYISVIVLTILFQGLNARYYFARREMLASYMAETPTWIIKIQKQMRS